MAVNVKGKPYRAMVSYVIEADSDSEAQEAAYMTAKALDGHVEFIGEVLEDDTNTVTNVVEQNTRFHLP